MKLKVQPGRLPPFKECDVVFFANLLSLFYGNEGQTESLRREVSRLESYGGRLAPILNLLFKGNDNLLVLQREPNPALLDYFQEELNLQLPEMVVLPYADLQTLPEALAGPPDAWGESVTRMAGNKAEFIDGFVMDNLLRDVAERLGKTALNSPESSMRGNNKYLLQAFLEREGLPCFDTERATGPDEVRTGVGRLKDRGYNRAVLKSQVGASGIGMIQFDVNAIDELDIPEYLFFQGPCLVQGWLEVGINRITGLHSPSVQLFVDEDSVYLYDVTEQILSHERIHQGNQAPPPYLRPDSDVRERMLSQAATTGAWLFEQRYRGTASIDFVLVERSGEIEVVVCEVNARVTGATYPSVLARHFIDHGSWTMRNLILDQALSGSEIIQRLRKNDILYSLDAPEGLLPINFNLDEHGRVDKGQFLCLSTSPTGCRERMDEMEKNVPLNWSHDRD